MCLNHIIKLSLEDRVSLQGFTEKCCDWLRDFRTSMLTMGFPGGSDGKESACNVGDLGSIPGLGKSPGEGKGYSLQYSGQEKSMGSQSLILTLFIIKIGMLLLLPSRFSRVRLCATP